MSQQSIDGSDDGIVISDLSLPDAPVICANAAFTCLTGYPADEIIGRNCRFLQNDNPYQDDLDKVRAALRDRLSVRATLRNYRRDGSLFWNEITLYPLQDPQGNAHYFGALQRDVSREIGVREQTAELVYANALLRQEIAERSRTEQALATTKTILTIAQQVTQLGTWGYDFASGEMEWSDEVFTIFGLAPQSIKPALAIMLIPSDDRAAAARRFRDCILMAVIIRTTVEFCAQTVPSGMAASGAR